MRAHPLPAAATAPCCRSPRGLRDLRRRDLSYPRRLRVDAAALLHVPGAVARVEVDAEFLGCLAEDAPEGGVAGIGAELGGEFLGLQLETQVVVEALRGDAVLLEPGGLQRLGSAGLLLQAG